MIYFLYGIDTYRSRQKAAEIIAAYREKRGSDAPVTRIDAESDPALVLGVGRTRNLFSEKELVLIEGVSKASREIQDHIRTVLPTLGDDPSFTLIFWEGGARFTKESVLALVAKHAKKSQEFKKLAPAAVAKWIQAEAVRQGARLGPRDAAILAARFGGDLWAISNELAKVSAGWKLESELPAEEKIWSFTDAFLKSPRSSFRSLSHLIAAGFEPYYLLGALAGSLRTLALVWVSAQTGKSGALKSLHPFVVKKNTELARNIDERAMRQLFERILHADWELKTGVTPGSLPLVKLSLRK